MLDAPVSGGEIGAINATLSIMVGGDEAAFARVRPILAVHGQRREDRPHRPVRRRADLQGLQPDGDRRRARRRQRGVRAREEGGRRRRARAPGAARRLRREPRARSARRADADRTTTSRDSAPGCIRRICASPTKRPRRTRSRCPRPRSSRSWSTRWSRPAAPIWTTRRSERCCSRCRAREWMRCTRMRRNLRRRRPPEESAPRRTPGSR